MQEMHLQEKKVMNKKEQLLEEFKLRRLIRKAKEAKKHIKEKNQLVEEKKLRHVIRHLITEGDVDADTNPVPLASTALSALADAFNQILPVLKTGLRKLKRPEERQSYRAHVLQKFSDMFTNFEGLDAKETGAIGESDLNEQEEDKKVTISVDDPDRIMPSDGKEDDRFKKESLQLKQKIRQELDLLLIQSIIQILKSCYQIPEGFYRVPKISKNIKTTPCIILTFGC